MNARPVPIWDLPLRLFHWSLPLLVAASWASAEFDRLDIHEWCGYTMLTLLGFRIVWGFMGSTHARFGSFLKSPRAVMAYWRDNSDTTEGHNPAGGWSVMLMLALLLTQAVTGLFNKDDVAFSGPLAHTVSRKVAGALGTWHEINFNLLLFMIGAHVVAVFYYQRRGKDLLRPMIGGGKSVQGARTSPSWLALPVLAGCAVLLWLLLSLVPAPQVFM